jgi:hypothetical protein
VQVSPDLETWSTLTPEQFTAAIDRDHPGFEDVAIQLAPPFGEENRFFVRLQITVAPAD